MKSTSKLLLMTLVIGIVMFAAYLLLGPHGVADTAEAVPKAADEREGGITDSAGRIDFPGNAMDEDIDLENLLQTVRRHEERIISLENQIEKICANAGAPSFAGVSEKTNEPVGSLAPDTKEKVREVLQEETERLRQEKIKQKEERDRQKSESKFAKVALQLGWDEYAARQVKDTVTEHLRQLFDIEARYAAGADRAECTRLVEEVFASSTTAVIAIVGEDNMSTAYSVLKSWKDGKDDLLDDVYDNWKRAYKYKAASSVQGQ
ncbi:MAG: hypothetical protein ACYS8W_08705 [Planctomycetota bacterium]|jgi:bacterioferritin-associated ferredoxin